MDIENIINEVVDRLMRELQVSNNKTKFIQCIDKKLDISGCEGIILEEKMNLEKINDYEFLVVEELNVDEMTAAARGLSINKKTKAIQKFFLNDKRVYILENGLEYRKYKEVSNKLYFNALAEYEKLLISFGACVVKQIKNINSFAKKNDVRELKDNSKRLVTEAIAYEMIDANQRTVSENTLITPSAKDVFSKNGIEICIR